MFTAVIRVDRKWVGSAQNRTHLCGWHLIVRRLRIPSGVRVCAPPSSWQMRPPCVAWSVYTVLLVFVFMRTEALHGQRAVFYQIKRFRRRPSAGTRTHTHVIGNKYKPMLFQYMYIHSDISIVYAELHCVRTSNVYMHLC